MAKRIVFENVKDKFNNKIKGQTRCECGRRYTNFKRPRFCECRRDLGSGLDTKMEISSNEAVKISEGIYSVRVNPKGHSTRAFVNLQTQTCYVKECVDNKSVQQVPCVHIKKCEESKLQARETIFQNDENILLSYGFSKDQSDSILKSDKGETRTFSLDGISGPTTVVVNSYQDASRAAPAKLVHISNGVCELVSCKPKSGQSHIDTQQLCIHTMIADVAGSQTKSQTKPQKRSDPDRLINQTKTVDKVLLDIEKNFPQIHEKEKIKEFLIKTKSVPDDLSEHCLTVCEDCGTTLEKWKYDRQCLLIEFHKVSNIETVSRYCRNCRIVYYPKVGCLGLVQVHNRCVISFEFVMDIYDQMKIGTPLCKYISLRLKLLLKKSENIYREDLDPLCREIQSLSVVILSIMTTSESLNTGLCIVCGLFPLIVSTDGNSKNNCKIDPQTMFFEKNDDPLYTLKEFKVMLNQDVARCGFFQNPERARINLNLLPPIIAEKVQGEVINSESKKNSQYDEDELEFKDVNLNRFVELLNKGNHDITKLSKCTLAQLKNMADECNISYPANCGRPMLIEKCKAVHKLISGGASNTHGYTCKQKYTGGWQDCWCSHGVKYGAKVEARKESCVDAVDLTRSLIKRPVVHIADDVCGVTNNEIINYPEESAQTLGLKRRGCFSDVHPRKKPKRGESCDLNGLCCEDLKGNAKVDHTDIVDGPLVHPDTKSSRRYRFGHNLGVKKVKKFKNSKVRKSKVSHKKNMCAYHDIKLCRQGDHIVTMMQEAQQVRRNVQRKKADRSHTFSLSFIFNLVLDYAHNEEKLEKKIKSIEKNSKTKFKERNQNTWRGVFE